MTPYYTDHSGQLYHGNCLDVMRLLPSDSIDTIVTDPPYGLSFMGKKWDYDVPSVEIWKECLRVLKPGATALIFAGSRTQHRMAVNVEDAGFILKDTIMWLYGSGFPKSTDISKQLDKAERAQNVVRLITALLNEGETLKDIGKKCKIPSLTASYNDWINRGHKPEERSWDRIVKGLRISETEGLNIIKRNIHILGGGNSYTFREGERREWESKKIQPKTPEAQTWCGYGTALKPAYEPILVAMKPNDGTYAQNALKHGVAGLNIDGGRIKIDLNNETRAKSKNTIQKSSGISFLGTKANTHNTPLWNFEKGRFPANLILDEEAGRLLDEQSGITKSTGGKNSGTLGNKIYSKFKNDSLGSNAGGLGDTGGASRFFYCAKASKSERGDNNHPTVKPLKLIEYLCMLTKTPSGGTVLDPFAGSGTTGLACCNTKRSYILIEREDEYCRIAKKRLENLRIEEVLRYFAR